MTSTSSPAPASKTSVGPGSTIVRGLAWYSGAGSLVIAVALALYAMQNDSGHTGFEPWLLAVVFAGSLIVGLAVLFFSRGSRTAALFACVAGVLGLALLFYLDRFDVLLQYERWIDRGMP